MDRGERLALFVRRLLKAAPASSYEDARIMFDGMLNSVEDEYSGMPYDPQNWRNDGRMYPPGDDFERKSPFAGVRVFRTRGHYVLIGAFGAIKVVSAAYSLGSEDAEVLLDKPGADGRNCPDQD